MGGVWCVDCRAAYAYLFVLHLCNRVGVVFLLGPFHFAGRSLRRGVMWSRINAYLKHLYIFNFVQRVASEVSGSALLTARNKAELLVTALGRAIAFYAPEA